MNDEAVGRVKETIEAKQGVNKNRVIDNLDDLDREFCQTWDKLLTIYKRIMIRAYDIKEELERLEQKGENSMRAEQEIKDELRVFETKLADMELCKHLQERSIKDLKLRIEVIKWTLKGEKNV